MGEQYRNIKQLQDKLGVAINNNLLLQAVTHTSYAHENRGQVMHNERLEFLGDAVLELVISEALYNNHPDMPEGELTKLRAELVCELSLAQEAQKLQLGSYLRLGKGEESTGGRGRRSTLADAFEALIGAIYIDKGFEYTKKLILQLFSDKMSQVSKEQLGDYKTMVQEKVQDKYGKPPHYKIVEESGPDHNKLFVAEVYVNQTTVGRGSGKNKKEAEQRAAKCAIQELDK